MNLKALKYTASKLVPTSLRKSGIVQVLPKEDAKEMRSIEELVGTPLPNSCTLVEVHYQSQGKIAATILLNGETGEVLRKYGPVFHRTHT